MAIAELASDGARRGGISDSTRKALLTARLALPVKLYLLSVVLPVWFYLGPLAMNLNRLFLVAMIVPLLFGLLSGRCGKLILTDYLFLLHLFWMGLTLQVNSPSQMVTQMGSMGIEFIGGYLMGRTYIRTPEDFAALTRWVVVMILCTAPLALYETITGDPIAVHIIRSLPGIFSVAENTYPPRSGFWRVQTVFAHPIHYGLFCTVGFSLLLVGMKDIVDDKRRRWGSSIMCASGLSSLSSGALLANVMQFGLIGWEKIFQRSRRRWYWLLALIAFCYVTVDMLSNRTPLQVFLSYATFSAHNAYYRMLIFEWGMVNVWANPIYGLGMNDWVRAWYMHTSSMDNFWLLITVRYGIPAFLLLAIGYGYVIARAIVRDFSKNEVMRNFRLAWVLTFLGLTFTLCTVHIWHSLYSFVFFMFASGIWLISYQPSDEDGEAEVVRKPASPQRYSRGVDLEPALTRGAQPERSFSPQAAVLQSSRNIVEMPLARRLSSLLRRDSQAKDNAETRQDLPYTRFPRGQ